MTCMGSSSELSGDEEDHDMAKDEDAINQIAGEWQGNRETRWAQVAAVYFRHSTWLVHFLTDKLCG